MRSLVLFSTLLLAGLSAQAEATPPPSELSAEASFHSALASVAVSEGTLKALSAGGRFVVKSVQASGEGVSVVIEKVGEGVSFVVHLSATSAASAGLAVSTPIIVSVVAGGYLLSHAGKPFAFVANPRTREMIHSKEIG
ncbi:hypothetical protein CO614_10245 [Lysobacteraceae bacterium NML120232]|nr:hypothetical protein CO614_10245 [Xanthomonadaceae bacterium NML120232]PJK10270.1 hypothetical protein CO608_06280 [Xanthomonadaceae bacterium NML08-0793]